MTKKANEDIRKAASEAGVKLWMVAEAIGMNDSCFSRLLRRELPDERKQTIFQAIEQVAKEAV